MQGEMTLKDFFQLIKKRIIMISVTATIIVALTALVTLYFFKPVYEAKEYILVGNLQNKNQENSYEETQKIPRMLASTVDFIKSPVVLNTVKERLGLNGTAFEEKLAIENNKDSQIIVISVRDHEEKMTKSMAKTTATITVEKMNSLLQFDQLKILEKSDDLVKKNNETAALAISLIIGIFAGIGLAVIREQFDNSIKRERSVEELLGVPVLGSFSGKAEIRKSTKGMHPYTSRNHERRSLIVHEKEEQVDKAAPIS